MKRYLVGGLVLSSLIATQAMAFKAVPYVGAAFGRNDGSWKFDNSNLNIISKYDRLLGYSGNFFVGYDLVFGKFALGAEATAGVSDASFHFDSSANNSDDKYKFHNYFGFGMVPSYQINGSLLFSRVDMVWGKLQYTTDVTVQESAEFNEYRKGGLFGVGIMAPLSKRFALRTEYDWSIYGDTSETAANGTSLQWKRNMMDTYMMGLNYYFVDRFDESNLVPLRHGFYFGLGATRDVPRINEKRSTATTVEYWDKGLSGLAGTFIAGYDIHPWTIGRFLSRLNFGVEATASYSNAEYKFINKTNSSQNYKFRMRDAYTLAGVFGVNVTPSNEVFFTLGGGAGRFLKTGGEFFGKNFNKYRPAAIYSIGDQMALCKALSLRIDGEYAKYSQITTTGTDTNNYRWKPRDERVTMSLVYHV